MPALMPLDEANMFPQARIAAAMRIWCWWNGTPNGPDAASGREIKNFRIKSSSRPSRFRTYAILIPIKKSSRNFEGSREP